MSAWKTRGVTIKNRSWLLKKYSRMSITEALETAKLKFTMLAARLRDTPEKHRPKRLMLVSPKNKPRCNISCSAGKKIQEQTYQELKL